MRVAVLGNCTVAGLALALQQILKTSEVFPFEISAVFRERTVERTLDVLKSCDAVFTHAFEREAYGPLRTSVLREAGNVAVMPTLIFTGFHPDIAPLNLAGKTLLNSVTGPNHSRITMAGFAGGFGVERTLQLFNRDVFQKLGYFEEFGKARAFLRKTMEQRELDFGSVFDAWMSRAPFMHTFNHPKQFVLASVAGLLAKRYDLIPGQTPIPESAYDELSFGTQWPVYPGLAEALGVEGSYLFKRIGQTRLAYGDGVLLTLREFVARCFEDYAAFPREAFENASISQATDILRGEV